MKLAKRVLAGLIGLALIACVADATIKSIGGYSADSATLTIVMAFGLAAGSAVVGWAWQDGLRPLALVVAFFVICGEAYTLIKVAEITMAEREKQQAPIIQQAQDRAKAEERLNTARTAQLTAGSDTPRLLRALAAKVAADNAVIAKAAEKGCAVNCKELLKQQVETATGEVTSARSEITEIQQRAANEVADANAALAKFAAPQSPAPLAALLDLPAWIFDLAEVVLRSLGGNGLAAALVAYASHGQQRRGIGAAVPASPARPIALPRNVVALRPKEQETGKVAQFMLEQVKPVEGAREEWGDLYVGYELWCAESGFQPLAPPAFGADLMAFCDKADIGVQRRGSNVYCLDVRLAKAASRQLEFSK